MFSVSEASYDYAPKYSAFKYAAAKLVAGGCGPGWHQYNKRCYWFSREKLNWYTASVSDNFFEDFTHRNYIFLIFTQIKTT